MQPRRLRRAHTRRTYGRALAVDRAERNERDRRMTIAALRRLRDLSLQEVYEIAA